MLGISWWQPAIEFELSSKQICLSGWTYFLSHTLQQRSLYLPDWRTRISQDKCPNVVYRVWGASINCAVIIGGPTKPSCYVMNQWYNGYGKKATQLFKLLSSNSPCLANRKMEGRCIGKGLCRWRKKWASDTVLPFLKNTWIGIIARLLAYGCLPLLNCARQISAVIRPQARIW